jgi:hypothetical protein
MSDLEPEELSDSVELDSQGMEVNSADASDNDYEIDGDFVVGDDDPVERLTDTDAEEEEDEDDYEEEEDSDDVTSDDEEYDPYDDPRVLRDQIRFYQRFIANNGLTVPIYVISGQSRESPPQTRRRLNH